MSDQRLVTETETRRRIELHDYEAVFASGGCFHFALCLHQRFSYRIRGIREAHDGRSLSHVWCLKQDQTGVDIRGSYPENLLAKLANGGKPAPIYDVPETEVRERAKAMGYPPDLEKELFELAGWIIENHERFADAKPVDDKQVAECLEDLKRSSKDRLAAEAVTIRLVSCDRVVAAQLVNIPRVNMPIRIYADFNAQTEDEKVSLSTVGSQADLEKIETPLVEGMTVVLYDEELEVQARLERFKDGVRWLGVPDWSTKRYK